MEEFVLVTGMIIIVGIVIYNIVKGIIIKFKKHV